MARRREACATACIALAALLCAPAAADAATYVLRPNATVGNAWTVNPAGSSADAVLDDDVLQPALPSTLSDYINQNTNGPRVSEVEAASQQLAPGETVADTTAWAYLSTGSRRSVTLELMTGGTSLASTTVPQGTPIGWKSVSTATALSQGQIDDLRIKLTLTGTGGSTQSFVYAAYVELRTAGVLAVSGAGSPSFGVTLDGTDKTATYDAPLEVTDIRDTSPGWNLAVSTTQFSTGGATPSLLPLDASSITAVTATCDLPPCTSPVNLVTYPIAVTAEAPAVKFFNAAPATGTGQHTITPTFRVAVPANTDAGSYTSTLTVTIGSGP